MGIQRVKALRLSIAVNKAGESEPSNIVMALLWIEEGCCMGVIPDEDKRMVPWPLRFVLWAAVVLLCAGIGTLGAHFLMPLWVVVLDTLSSIPLLADFLNVLTPGPVFLGAVVGIVVNNVLSKAYIAIRGVGEK